MKENTTIKIWIETRRKLKILAAMTGKSLMECIDDLANEGLDRQKEKLTTEGKESVPPKSRTLEQD
jgi:hypothetical protein